MCRQRSSAKRAGASVDDDCGAPRTEGDRSAARRKTIAGTSSALDFLKCF
jgi:hypothetical protein